MALAKRIRELTPAQRARAEEYFDYVVKNKKGWCHGFTLKKLEAVKEDVFTNHDIMWDLLDRHRFMDGSPEQQRIADIRGFEHGIGNFTTSILYTMVKR